MLQVRCEFARIQLALLCDFKDDFEFDRHPKRQTGHADHLTHSRFLRAKDIAKQI
jgi:hypothetical protein